MKQPYTNKMENLVAATKSLRSMLRAASRQQPNLAAGVIFHLKVEFSNRFWQALQGSGPIIWPDLTQILRRLTMD